MTNFDNTNRGSLFRNDRREKDSQPEYTGSINIEGVEYWLSGWVKEGKGKKFFSLSVKPKEPMTLGHDPAPPARRGSLKDQLDDDLPF